jgi:hypothetical protein
LVWAKLPIDSLLKKHSRGVVVNPVIGLFHPLEYMRKQR